MNLALFYPTYKSNTFSNERASKAVDDIKNGEACGPFY